MTDREAYEKLKPCPFCGKRAEISYDEDSRNYKIQCPRSSCGIFEFHIDSDSCSTKEILLEETISAWNRRGK